MKTKLFGSDTPEQRDQKLKQLDEQIKHTEEEVQSTSQELQWVISHLNHMSLPHSSYSESSHVSYLNQMSLPHRSYSELSHILYLDQISTSHRYLLFISITSFHLTGTAVSYLMSYFSIRSQHRTDISCHLNCISPTQWIQWLISHLIHISLTAHHLTGVTVSFLMNKNLPLGLIYFDNISTASWIAVHCHISSIS